MGWSHYRHLDDALTTSMPTETDAEYIVEQGELDFRALSGRDMEAQVILKAVDDDTVAVEHFEKEKDLIDTYRNQLYCSPN